MSQTVQHNPAEVDAKWIRRFFISLFLLIAFLGGGVLLLLQYGDVITSLMF